MRHHVLIPLIVNVGDRKRRNRDIKKTAVIATFAKTLKYSVHNRHCKRLRSIHIVAHLPFNPIFVHRNALSGAETIAHPHKLIQIISTPFYQLRLCQVVAQAIDGRFTTILDLVAVHGNDSAKTLKIGKPT